MAGVPLINFNRRSSGLFCGANECFAAAPRSRFDERGALDSSAKFQRKFVDLAGFIDVRRDGVVKLQHKYHHHYLWLVRCLHHVRRHAASCSEPEGVRLDCLDRRLPPLNNIACAALHAISSPIGVAFELDRPSLLARSCRAQTPAFDPWLPASRPA